jgi:hypothetical protein
MKLIAYYENAGDADAAALLLRSRGILPYVSSQATKTLRGMIFASSKVGLWAVLDHQFDDAVLLLEDSDHEVSSGLSESEMLSFEDTASRNVFASLNKAIFFGLLLIIAMVWLMLKVAAAQ